MPEFPNEPWRKIPHVAGFVLILPSFTILSFLSLRLDFHSRKSQPVGCALPVGVLGGSCPLVFVSEVDSSSQEAANTCMVSFINK